MKQRLQSTNVNKNARTKPLLAMFVLGLGLMLQPLGAIAYQVGDHVDESVLKALNIDSNKITIVDFFASWCASCKKEIPMLDAMELDTGKVELLGVCTDKKLKKGLAFQEKLNIKFRVFNDTTQDVVSAFSPFGMPALYFVQRGVVKKIHFGAMPNIDRIVAEDIEVLSSLVITEADE